MTLLDIMFILAVIFFGWLSIALIIGAFQHNYLPLIWLGLGWMSISLKFIFVDILEFSLNPRIITTLNLASIGLSVLFLLTGRSMLAKRGLSLSKILMFR